MTDEECRRPVADLLRADVDELEGCGSTELAGHIRACERCGALARSILSGYEALDDTLEAAVRVQERWIVALGQTRAARGVRHRSRWALPIPPVWAAATVAAASIAAALALVLPAPLDPPLEQVWLPPASAASVPVVSAAQHNVAVIQTDDPDITVFWFYKE